MKSYRTGAAALIALLALAGCGDGYSSMSRLEYRGDPPPMTEHEKLLRQKTLQGDGSGKGAGYGNSGGTGTGGSSK